jgi:hypothetical protein
MLARPWNTIAKRNILMDLMELLFHEMGKEYNGNADNLDNYLMGFWEGDDDMDLSTLPSVDSDDPIEDLDPTFGEEEDVFGEEDKFDAINTLLPLMVVYGEYIVTDLQSNVEFNSQHLRITLLSDVECVDDFRFRKEYLKALFNLFGNLWLLFSNTSPDQLI